MADDAPAPRCAGLSDHVMHRVFRHIQDNIAGPLTLEQLASVACISRYHFARTFRARTGSSPMQYVQALRIEMAKHMLIEGGASLCAIAVSLGFFDQSHFNRVFRKTTGWSPGSYARRFDTREAARTQPA